ncbi:hypothetical protein UO65_3901 [Actinokineospora spheciospongiae]|uniref:Uncharacterized protein n=1 Tax=Actinokineospora spheciospongiae TaxID=909613 RepID=W7IVL7_9PSEU|nr:hypothetical protein [Actinokineospora spheciospongiae]EWC60802.1 hypothetical protein UO65_3901 [Actinokineospora spheciospongiae]
MPVLTRASADVDHGPRTGRLHLFDPTTGAAEDLGPVEAEAHSPAWWQADDGWHLGHIALTPTAPRRCRGPPAASTPSPPPPRAPRSRY